MKLSKSALYPLGAILIVAAFWGALTVVQKPRRPDSSSVGPTSAPTGANPGGVRAQQPEAKSQSSAPPAQRTANQVAVPPEAGRAWLGVKLRERTLAIEEDEQPVPAAEILEVKPGSPAEAAGLRKGDMIVGARRQPLVSALELEKSVAGLSPGEEVSLQLIRSGEPLELALARGSTDAGGSKPAQYAPAENPLAATGSPVQGGRTGIFINGREIGSQQAQQLKATYGYLAPPSRYWYDSRSGLFGVVGREAAGFMRPGSDFGPLPANASSGNTGVFINGREINMVEAAYCQRLFGAVYQGHWWLDGRTGNMGAEGNPTPLVNVFVALQQAQRSSQGGSYGWHSNVTGASGGSSGGCSYVSIPGSGSVMSGNCD